MSEDTTIDRLEWNDATAQTILKLPAVTAELMRRGGQAAAAASAETGRGRYTVTTGLGATRTHVRVFTGNSDAREAEATARTLTRALDAAR